MKALCCDQLSAVVEYLVSLVEFEGMVEVEFDGMVLVASGKLVYWICLLQGTPPHE